MMTLSAVRRSCLALALCFVVSAASAQVAAPADETFKPRVGQQGKDVVWVPTPDALVERMLDLAQVTSTDYVIDLGSGDGRTVIAAAKRGARAHGIEYNENMVALAIDAARRDGVSDRATFEKADLFQSDFSKASVITMFLLSQINLKLRPILLDLAPGTRIVSNTFKMAEWEPDETSTIGDCASWCDAHLWIVPAKVDGTWQLGGRDLVLSQQFQRISGTVIGMAITDGRVRGDEISFSVGEARYTGKVKGNTMEGTITNGPAATWEATR
jgi:hypothetical protein